MPRAARVCSVIDCNRTHHAKGYCKHHNYLERKRQARRAKQAFCREPAPENAVRGKTGVSA